MSKVDVKERRELGEWSARIWKEMVAMGIAIPLDPLPVELRKKLRRELKTKPRPPRR